MRNILFPLISMLIWPFWLSAQTPVERLQNAVEGYNALREYASTLTPQTIKDENMTDLKNRMDKGIALLDQVIKEGNADQIKAARYFKTNFMYQYGFAWGIKGNNAMAYEYFKTIQDEMSNYSAADFPIRYVFFDKNYVVNWENFASTQAEFLTGYTEILFNLGHYRDSYTWSQKALAHSHINSWLRYITYNKILDIYNKKSDIDTGGKRADYALSAIKAYDALSEEEKKTAKDNNYPTVKRASVLIVNEANATLDETSARRCAEAAPICAKYESENANVLQLYEIVYKRQLSVDAPFSEAAESYARNMRPTSATTAEYVAVAALHHLSTKVGYNECEKYRSLAEKMAFWGQKTKEAQLLKQSEQCFQDRVKAEQRAQRAARRANRNFNLYTGVYLFPLLTTNARRDYGGVVNFVFKRTALEFSYLKVREKKENTFDLWVNDVDADQDNLSRWNGYYAHFQPKFIRSNRTYWGILAGYAEKNFDEMSVSAYHDATGLYSYLEFEPSVRQYIGMFNWGGLALTKGFGMDIYMGIGANYSRFDDGGTVDRSDYTIDNPILENRKDAYFGLIVRLGMTVGLNFGRGNQR